MGLTEYNGLECRGQTVAVRRPDGRGETASAEASVRRTAVSEFTFTQEVGAR